MNRRNTKLELHELLLLRSYGYNTREIAEAKGMNDTWVRTRIRELRGKDKEVIHKALRKALNELEK